MEPRDRAAEALSRSRVRLGAACLIVIGLALVQDPGFLVPDTKFDLVEAPGDFLARSLHLWDEQGAFGQLQNQAYGYLWPMGPFFAAGVLGGLPAWLVQRLWIGLVMAVALIGTVKVTRAFGVRSDLAALSAGFAFALSPRMLTTLGPISIEAWPSAVAPWVLLALVHGSRGGSPRRWAAAAGLGVAMVGGVNAAATFAVIPLGVVWLLTRTPGPRRRALMLWWPVFTLLGTLWWLVPLFVMGAYSPPFLDFIETTTVTTFPTDLFDTLRGTSNWVPYVDPGSRAGFALISTSYLVLNSGVVLMVGFAGLLHRRTPERGFLTVSVLLGALMVGLGHNGVVEGWFAADLRGLLDGALSPLRNVHKFDVVLRLPLVLGLAFVLDRAVAARSASAGDDTPLQRSNQVAVTAMVLVAVVGSVVPALTGRITPTGAMLDVPQYWQQTASWLEENDEGTALVVPGAPFASYVWGAPRDEPLQYYADSRWAVRNIIPLTPAGNIRMLDEVERRIAQGAGSPGLAAYLRRAGVEHVVVRNDLQPGSDVPAPVVVHQVLRDSGLLRVADFGPEVGGGATLDGEDDERVVVNGGWQALYPAIEIFEVPSGDEPTGATGAAVMAGAPATVVGGPEDLADLADLDLVGDAPVRLAADLGRDEPPAADAPLVLTDGLRDRERFFGRVHDGYSPVWTPGDVPRNGSPVRDYRLAGADRWSTTVRLDGARTVAASGSRSDSTSAAERGELPYAAVDGSPATEWVSAGNSPWWRLDLNERLDPGTVPVTGGDSAPRNQRLRVVTEAGASAVAEVGPGQTLRVDVPPGATSWVRVEDASGDGRAIAVAEVAVAGLEVRRRLVTPVLPSGWRNPDAVLLRADLDARKGCIEVDSAVRCVESRSRTDEESTGFARVVTLPEADTWEPALTVLPRSSRSLSRAIQRDQAVRVLASSTPVPDPRAGPVAAIDGDRGTTWLAGLDDPLPTLSLRWLGVRTIAGIRLSVEDGTAAQAPTRVRLVWPDGSREVELEDGEAAFRGIRTDRLDVRVLASDSTTDLGFDAQPVDVPVGVSELELVGLPYLPLGLSSDVRATGCGLGPDVEVGGTVYETFVEASPAELLRGDPVPAGLCPPGDDGTGTEGAVDALPLGAGENDVTVRASRGFVPRTLVLTRDDASLATEPPSAVAETGSAVERRLVPDADDDARVLQLRQNANDGWTATQGGDTLRPVVLDGWQQGWLVEDAEPVTASFAPDRTYRVGLLAGLVALLALVGLCVLLVRRRHLEDASAEALTGRRLPVVAASLVGVLAGGLLCGWIGVAVAVATAGLTVWAAPRSPDLVQWLPAAACLASATAFAIRPWTGPDGWAGSLPWTAYVVLVPLVAALVAGASARENRLFSRRAGRSTTR